MDLRADGCDKVFVLEPFRHFDFLTEYIELAVTSDKTDEVYITIFKR